MRIKVLYVPKTFIPPQNKFLAMPLPVCAIVNKGLIILVEAVV